MERTARIAALTVLTAASVLSAGLLADWWPAAGSRIAWHAVAQAPLLLALAVAAAVMTGVAVVARDKIRLRLSVLPVVCAGAALAIVIRWLTQRPGFSLAELLDHPPATAALAAAAMLTLAALILAVTLPAAKRCPDCAERVVAGADICKHCGWLFEPGRGHKRCSGCSTVVHRQAQVCKFCGVRFAQPRDEATGRAEITTF
jgi:hypothetical protein